MVRRGCRIHEQGHAPSAWHYFLSFQAHMTMPVSASQVFAFLDQYPSCVMTRHELYSPPFSRFRRSLSAIIVRLLETDDVAAIDVADRLRDFICEFLKVPVAFDASMREPLSLLGDTDAVATT